MAVSMRHSRTFTCVLSVLLACVVSVRGDCRTEEQDLCGANAVCDEADGVCKCDVGAFGDGYACATQAWTVRFNLIMPNGTAVNARGRLPEWNPEPGGNVEQFALLMFNSGVSMPTGFLTSMDHSTDEVEGKLYLVVNALFATIEDARAARDILAAKLTADPPLVFGVNVSNPDVIPVEPRVYRWELQTTSAALQIDPTGMTVDSVSFSPSCGEVGCWVLGITYTTGRDNFNTFFIPRAELPNSTLSYDYDYDSARNTNDLNWLDWGKTALDTFSASNFPCGSATYDPTQLHRKSEFVMGKRFPSPPDAVTSCCLPEFFDMYRPIEDFVTFFEEHPRARVRKDRCDGGLVETWHRPGWPNPILDPPIPPKWENDGTWNSMQCDSSIVHEKLNSRFPDDMGYYFEELGVDYIYSAENLKGFFVNAKCWAEGAKPSQSDSPTGNCDANGGCDDTGSKCCVYSETDGFKDRRTCYEQLPGAREGNVRWMKSPECYINDPSVTQGSLDMGCYDDGEVKSWVITAPAVFSDAGDGTFNVESEFGPGEAPVVIIDVLSLSLEDEDKAGKDRWDSLVVGICTHHDYFLAGKNKLRNDDVKMCVEGTVLSDDGLHPGEAAPIFFFDGSDFPQHFIDDYINEITDWYDFMDDYDEWAKEAEGFWQTKVDKKQWFSELGFPEDPSVYEVRFHFAGYYDEGAYEYADSDKWVYAGMEDYDGTVFDEQYGGLHGEEFVAAIDAAVNATKVPFGIDCDGLTDCLWDYKFCSEWVDKRNQAYGWHYNPPEPVAPCGEIEWQSGGDYNSEGRFENTGNEGQQLEIQSGVRAGFRVIACTGSAIVKFISDSHSAHSTGFTINWRIVPQSEVKDWTGDKYGFSNGNNPDGWECPTEPRILYTHDIHGQANSIARQKGQVIKEEWTVGGGEQSAIPPYTRSHAGLVFPPTVDEVVGSWSDNANAFCNIEAIEEVFGDYENVPAYHDIPPNYLTGRFAGMNHSWVEFTSVLDPYIKQYKATVYLDDKELREKAGMLRGTVGVEYSIDTFIGLANFKPTNTKFLDPAGMQTALHLEKNNFFAVSTHGVNEYTFLEYVNMRLVTILSEDADLLTETTDEFGDVTNRVERGNEAQYVQVTFTLGEQYQPIETGLIPMDSVIVSKGIFIEDASTTATREDVCFQWTTDTFGDKDDLEKALLRDCAPNAEMCINPEEIPDQFVAFNIPLGVDWLPPASDALDSNVFVEMVVSAIDSNVAGGSRDPLSGAPGQMKTTLTGSIPVVGGGVNIFCDAIVAKTDLTEVVKVDIVVGTANSGLDSELSRLRILTNVQSTDLNTVPTQSIESDSIESGLMTLVVKGDDTYFGLGGTGSYSVELEDVITIHIMESGNTMFEYVKGLVATAGDDNRDSAGVIDTDGYDLNQAFRFTIDTANNRAHLEPTDLLLASCPFRPQRPTMAEPFPTTCVTRRDIQGKEPQAATGAVNTAIELDRMEVAAADRGTNADFMQTILGANDYAENLGKTFSKVIADTYELNDRYRRAWWINPGYEWTPTQTGGQSIFTISQKFVLFALLNLNEGFRRRGLGTRRALLQATSDTKDTGSGLSSAMVIYQTSPASLLAQAYKTSTARVATYQVGVQLTQTEACMSESALRKQLQQTFADYASTAASPTETVQVVGLSVDRKGVQCRRSSTRQLLASFTDATADAEMLMVFKEGTKAVFNTDAFSQQPGIISISGMAVSDEVDVDVTYVNLDVDGSSDKDSDSSNIGLIAGCAAGGAVLVGLIGFVAYRLFGQRQEAEETEVAGVTVRDLKAQLTINQPSFGNVHQSSARNMFPPVGGGGQGSAGNLFARPPSLGSQGSHGNVFGNIGSQGNVFGNIGSQGNVYGGMQGSRGNVFSGMQGSQDSVQMAQYLQPQPPVSTGYGNGNYGFAH